MHHTPPHTGTLEPFATRCTLLPSSTFAGPRRTPPTSARHHHPRHPHPHPHHPPSPPPTRWAFWDGLRSYEAEFRPYLQGQIGNPDGDEKPNKKYYDPRMALRRGEEFMAKRLIEAAEDLNCINVI
mgnify:CR=1 FL=1